MKKFIIAAALVFTTGILASQTKATNPQPVQVNVPHAVSFDRKDLASGD
jgi:hypothetical protein